MRCILPYLILFLSPWTIFCQDFAPVGAEWIYERVDGSGRIGYKGPSDLIRVTKKEMYRGNEVSIIEGAFVDFDLRIFQDNEKIYFFSPHTDQFEILYDFNARVGDTIVIEGLDSNPTTGRCIQVIDSITLSQFCDLEEKKVWHTRYITEDKDGEAYWELDGRIVEGIGNIDKYFLPEFGLGSPHHCGLRCWSSTMDNCKFVEYGCLEILKVTSTQAANTIPITYQTSGDEIVFYFDHSSQIGTELTIYDYDGRNVSTHQIPTGSNVYNIIRPKGYMFIYQFQETKSGRRTVFRL